MRLIFCKVSRDLAAYQKTIKTGLVLGTIKCPGVLVFQITLYDIHVIQLIESDKTVTFPLRTPQDLERNFRFNASMNI